MERRERRMGSSLPRRMTGIPVSLRQLHELYGARRNDARLLWARRFRSRGAVGAAVKVSRDSSRTASCARTYEGYPAWRGRHFLKIGIFGSSESRQLKGEQLQ